MSFHVYNFALPDIIMQCPLLDGPQSSEGEPKCIVFTDETYHVKSEIVI